MDTHEYGIGTDIYTQINEKTNLLKSRVAQCLPVILRGVWGVDTGESLGFTGQPASLAISVSSRFSERPLSQRSKAIKMDGLHTLAEMRPPTHAAEGLGSTLTT